MDWVRLAVEGAISGLVVVTGVVLAATIERRRRARSSVETALLELGNLMTQTAAGLVSADVDRGMGSDWWQQRQRTWEILGNLRVQAHGFRGAKRVREEAEKLLAKFAAADSIVVVDGERLSPAVALELTTNDLHTAVFGKSRILQKEWEYWQARWREYPFPGGP